MAFEIPIVGGAVSTFKAEATLATKQFYFAEMGTAADEVDLCDNAGDLVLGVIQNKPAAGEAVQLRCYGVSKVVASGAITRGARVGTDASGKAVTKSADADLVAGIALETSTTDGDLIAVLLTPAAQRAS